MSIHLAKTLALYWEQQQNNTLILAGNQQNHDRNQEPRHNRST
jgi:hypothetical protein